MKRLAMLGTLIAAAALTAAPGASAAGDHDTLRVKNRRPVVFLNATAACPQGIATYGVRFRGTAGTGRNCITAVSPKTCPQGSNDLLCQKVFLRVRVRVPGGTLRARMTADEVWNCVDSACAKLRIHELWRGRVTKAHGRFADARGGRISGGGSLSVDAATFDVTGVDATLVIHAAGDDHAVA
jgi:hypothetical protein